MRSRSLGPERRGDELQVAHRCRRLRQELLRCEPRVRPQRARCAAPALRRLHGAGRMPGTGISLWMLVPYQVRVALWLVILALMVWAWFELDGALDRHYTAEQNALVAQDAARTNESAKKLAEGNANELKAMLARRDARIRVLEAKGKGQD